MLRAELAGKDALAVDNQAVALLPSVNEKKVVLVSQGNLFLESAVASHPWMQVVRATPANSAEVVGQADIVVYDHTSPDDTLIYYKRVYIRSMHVSQLVAAVVKSRQGVKFLYNIHSQQSGKVKGYHESVPPIVWYIAPGRQRRDFGL